MLLWLFQPNLPASNPRTVLLCAWLLLTLLSPNAISCKIKTFLIYSTPPSLSERDKACGKPLDTYPQLQKSSYYGSPFLESDRRGGGHRWWTPIIWCRSVCIQMLCVFNSLLPILLFSPLLFIPTLLHELFLTFFKLPLRFQLSVIPMVIFQTMRLSKWSLPKTKRVWARLKRWLNSSSAELIYLQPLPGYDIQQMVLSVEGVLVCPNDLNHVSKSSRQCDVHCWTTFAGRDFQVGAWRVAWRCPPTSPSLFPISSCPHSLMPPSLSLSCR